jgi:hypothetical protein
MLKFIKGDELPKAFKALMETTGRADMAVAYWGTGAESDLSIEKDRARIVCNLESGACNPDEIERLRNVAQVKTHAKLHAKCYLTEAGVIIGSSNASTNGLAMDGSGLDEANLVTDDPEIIRDAAVWFEEIWTKAKKVTDPDLKRAREKWNRLRWFSLNKSARSAIKVEEIPGVLESNDIWCIVVSEPLDPGAARKKKELVRNPPNKELSRAWYYQPIKPLKANSWLIHCNFKNRQPRIDGYALVPDPPYRWRTKKGELPLTAVFPQNSINIDGKHWQLSVEQKAQLISKLRASRDVQEALRAGEDVAFPLADLW